MNLEKVLEGGVLLFDGAMGTMLQKRGLPVGQASCTMNLTHPEVVSAIQREYVKAGARVISANTFGAHSIDAPVDETVRAGVACAKASGAEYVALSVGPVGKILQPVGEFPYAQAYELFSRHVTAGQAAGADFILIETMYDLGETKAAVLAAKEHTSLPVVCTMTFGEDGRTIMGCSARQAVDELEPLGVTALGVNCSTGPDQLLPVVVDMLACTRLPLLVQPNAGLPTMRGGEAVYDLSPEDFAEKMMQMAKLGAVMLGGCCGTTPEHIRTLAERLAPTIGSQR